MNAEAIESVHMRLVDDVHRFTSAATKTQGTKLERPKKELKAKHVQLPDEIRSVRIQKVWTSLSRLCHCTSMSLSPHGAAKCACMHVSYTRSTLAVCLTTQ